MLLCSIRHLFNTAMKDLKQLLKIYIQKNPYEVNAIKMLNFFNNHDGCFENIIFQVILQVLLGY